tara:strand:- start:318 stop:527 length:210 start_codon:yes stop_codon:yes gene_type:complete
MIDKPTLCFENRISVKNLLENQAWLEVTIDDKNNTDYAMTSDTQGFGGIKILVNNIQPGQQNPSEQQNP